MATPEFLSLPACGHPTDRQREGRGKTPYRVLSKDWITYFFLETARIGPGATAREKGTVAFSTRPASDDWKPENARKDTLSPEPDLASPLLGPFPLARLAPHIREERMGPIGWSIRENAIAATVYRPRRPQWLMKTADVVLDGAWCGYGHRLSRLLES